MSYNPSVRMVPRPLWGMNLRHKIPKSRWGKIRLGLIQERGLRCQTCGKTETESKHIFAHEEWQYETTCSPAVAHLKGLTLSCWHCHAVEHFGATGNMVLSGELTPRAIEDTIEHFCRVNQVDRDAFRRHGAEARAEWTRLNKLEWVIDWGPFQEEISKYEEHRHHEGGPRGMNFFQATQQAIKIAIGRGMDPNSADDIVKMVREDPELRGRVLSFGRDGQPNEAATLIMEALEEYRDEGNWEPLPDHEMVYTLDGELYGHR